MKEPYAFIKYSCYLYLLFPLILKFFIEKYPSPNGNPHAAIQQNRLNLQGSSTQPRRIPLWGKKVIRLPDGV